MKCAKPYWLEASGDRRFFIACGKCLYCKIQRRSSWTIRMLHEREMHEHACFVTLTYDAEHLPPRGLVKSDLQKFFKRLRRKLRARAGEIKYFACGEYGERFDGTRRPHYHAIIFGMSKLMARQVLREVWLYGLTDVGEAEEDSMRYVAQYIDKKYLSGDEGELEYGGRPRPFQLVSQGLGKSWLLENFEQVTNDGFKVGNRIYQVPRYYVEKLKEIHPGIADSLMIDREDKQRAREADYVMSIDEKDSRNFAELDEDTRKMVAAKLHAEGKAMNANLKAQAKIHALKKRDKRL